jgi:hypothetical protein
MKNIRIVDKILKRTWAHSRGEATLKIGDKVKIHPQLGHDPYKKRGKYGKIYDIYGKSQDYVIKFPDGQIGTYSNDTVLKVR